MQLPLFDEPFESAVLVMKTIDQDYIAVRFRITSRVRFDATRQRFRREFPFAVFREVNGKRWWVIAASQHERLETFRQANQLWLVIA